MHADVTDALGPRKPPTPRRSVRGGVDWASASGTWCGPTAVLTPTPSPSAGRANRMKSRTIKVDYLARVEGECALLVKMKGQQVTDVKLKVFEPPRFFEAFLRGRRFNEAPDITARICGICPVAYQMSACHAMEDAFGVRIPDPIRALRRLLYCGEWIESHALHVYLLLSLIHISEPTRRTPISYAVFC